MLNLIWSQLRNQKGQGMVEYGLILAFIAVVCTAAVTTLGINISGLLTGITFSAPAGQ